MIGKLYDVDREVDFLKFVASDWLPAFKKKLNAVVAEKAFQQQQIATLHVDNLKSDINLLIGK